MKKLTKQKWGLLSSLIACIIFWLPLYEVTEWFLFIPVKTTKISLLPSLTSGIIALIFIFLLYVRCIIVFNSKRYQFLSIFINWTVFSTFVEIVISPFVSADGCTIFQDNAFLVISAIIMCVILLCGVKEIAKIVLLIFILSACFSNLMAVSEAMGFLGFVSLAFVLAGFYLQQNIKIDGLKNEVDYLFLSHKQKIVLVKEIKHVK